MRKLARCWKTPSRARTPTDLSASQTRAAIVRRDEEPTRPCGKQTRRAEGRETNDGNNPMKLCHAAPLALVSLLFCLAGCGFYTHQEALASVERVFSLCTQQLAPDYEQCVKDGLVIAGPGRQYDVLQNCKMDMQIETARCEAGEQRGRAELGEAP